MTAVLAPVATATSPALGAPILREWLGRHVSDGLIAHWAPNSILSYNTIATCGLTATREAYAPYDADMAPCPTCFSPEQACLWCRAHCDEELRRDHQWLTGWAHMIGKPTLMPDGSLRPAPVELRVVVS